MEITINKRLYVADLERLAMGGIRPDCSRWPLVHTSASQRFDQIVSSKSPALVSRRLRDNARGDGNDEFVFTYAAPRQKPVREMPVVLLFRGIPDSAAGATKEIAHPFDSGGLRHHPVLRYSKPALVEALIFEMPWRPYLELFVAGLFEHSDAYLRGDLPDRRDPLGICDVPLPKEKESCLFFTWEIKTLDRIEFEGRLLAVIVSTDTDGRRRISEEVYDTLKIRERDDQIVLRTARRNDVASALFALYQLAPLAAGWRA